MKKLQLEIKHKPVGKRKKIVTTQTIYLPQSWAEVKYESMYQIAPQLLAASLRHFEASKIIVSACVQNQIKDIDFDDAKLEMEESIVANLIVDLEWMFDTPFGHTPFKSFKHQGTEYFMPASLFGNCVLGELMHVDFYLNKFAKTQNQDNLIKLLAVLARPAREEGDPERERDVRVKLMPETIFKRAEAFKGVEQGFVYANYQFVTGTLNYLNDKYKIFEEEETDKDKKNKVTQGPDFSGFKKKAGAKRRWKSVIHRLARHNKVSYWEWYYEKLYTALDYIDEELVEHELIKEAHEKQLAEIKTNGKA